MTGASAGDTFPGISEQSMKSSVLGATGRAGGSSRKTWSGLSGRMRGSRPGHEGAESKIRVDLTIL